MATISLIRHGQASFGQDDYDALSDVGTTQAEVLGRALTQQGLRFDAVYCGTMNRHQQTMASCLPASNRATALVIDDEQWNEYDHEDILCKGHKELGSLVAINEHVGRLQNPKKEFEIVFNQAMDRWMSGDFDQDYSESWPQFQARVSTALDNVVEVAHQGAKSIAVFTSGGVISVLAQRLLGVPSHKMMHMNWTLMNCAVTKLVATRDRLFVATLNEHSHFTQPQYQHLMTYR